MLKNTGWCDKQQSKRRFISVGSQASATKLHERKDKEGTILHRFHGWQLGWFEDACSDEEFWQQVNSNVDSEVRMDPDEPVREATRSERIAAKHYFAGASARMMFHMSTR